MAAYAAHKYIRIINDIPCNLVVRSQLDETRHMPPLSLPCIFILRSNRHYSEESAWPDGMRPSPIVYATVNVIGQHNRVIVCLVCWKASDLEPVLCRSVGMRVILSLRLLCWDG